MTAELNVKEQGRVIKEAKIGGLTVLIYHSPGLPGYVNISRFRRNGSLKHNMCFESLAGAEEVFNYWMEIQ